MIGGIVAGLNATMHKLGGNGPPKKSPEEVRRELVKKN